MTKTTLIQLVLLSLLSVSAITEDCSLFDQFVIDYNKDYPNETEKEYRRQVFCENMAELGELRRLSPDATFGVTEFSDRTHEEMHQSKSFII